MSEKEKSPATSNPLKEMLRMRRSVHTTFEGNYGQKTFQQHKVVKATNPNRKVTNKSSTKSIKNLVKSKEKTNESMTSETKPFQRTNSKEARENNHNQTSELSKEPTEETSPVKMSLQERMMQREKEKSSSQSERKMSSRLSKYFPINKSESKKQIPVGHETKTPKRKEGKFHKTTKRTEKKANNSVIKGVQQNSKHLIGKSHNTNRHSDSISVNTDIERKRSDTPLAHFYERKMKYLEEKTLVLESERKRREREEVRSFGRVPKVSERTNIMAELSRMRKKLIEDEKFIKRAFDQEKQEFRVVPINEYKYEKNEIKKKAPPHWTFDQVEQEPTDHSKQATAPPKENFFEKSYHHIQRDFHELVCPSPSEMVVTDKNISLKKETIENTQNLESNRGKIEKRHEFHNQFKKHDAHPDRLVAKVQHSVTPTKRNDHKSDHSTKGTTKKSKSSTKKTEKDLKNKKKLDLKQILEEKSGDEKEAHHSFKNFDLLSDLPKDPMNETNLRIKWGNSLVERRPSINDFIPANQIKHTNEISLRRNQIISKSPSSKLEMARNEQKLKNMKYKS